MSNLHPTIARVTDRIIEKSKDSRRAYLYLIDREADNQPERSQVSCSNLAHAFAGAEEDQEALKTNRGPNIGIVTSYNDMLSAHQPYGRYPERLKIYAREVGATAQVAGGTPAMCDGVTQGETGMELSLFSRDVIALSTGVALSHAMYDGMLLLGICDKIVPGLLMGALRFGHLPAVFVPSGPMPSGVSNKEKQRVRQLYAEGKATRAELLESELGSYHSPGTCTFFGTANSNQMMMEMMGLHVPGAAFFQPGTKIRQALDRAAVQRVTAMGRNGNDFRPLGHCVDEKAIVNAAVGLLATGGSTNHAIHIPAFARAAGVQIDWTDLSELSGAVPLLARVYPNGSGDTNHFHEAGGMGFVIKELTSAGLAHADVIGVGETRGMEQYGQEPWLDDDMLSWRDVGESGDDTMLRPASDPFQPDGGMRLVQGNLGRACFKSSAVEKERWTIEAPCRVFQTQAAVNECFKKGELDRDVVVVVRFQGPRANGMPELHKLTPALGVLQDRGYRVALVTDGRMSGASGKVPSAIHCSPEALGGGPLSLLQDGDVVKVCAETGELSTTADLGSRTPAPDPAPESGTGREIFAMFRNFADEAERGGSAMLATGGL
ncbi:phosphogluconate dehydratase [Aurantiacibacter gangjinensis]|uniref:Phosphogluconate dehydratase n=1 Tax=Aurantiacibacter gangjinensis TaxID=502682 RepID=A0A0G9MK24_9SPHN|nr:phosphogluconate dehydratase [Aurantiacibacter gangjinensis]APE29392.1 Phosphogluconate dehydratase [Aurantiacibacter gangjinensis]KLE31040.1 phosphogluconate dehydratase [Aurantiacibacter gangjinensis]